MAFDLTPVIDAMTQTDDAVDSAIVFIDSVPGIVQAAVDAATANGATAAQLQPVTDAAAVLKSKRDALVASLTANTPTPPPTPAPPAPVAATFKK